MTWADLGALVAQFGVVGARYVAISAHEGGRVTLALQLDTETDVREASAALGGTEPQWKSRNELTWIESEVRLGTLSVYITGAHRTVAAAA